MINSPLLWQRNPLWADDPLGTSNVTIKYYGCVITCLTAIAKATSVQATNNLFIQNKVYVNDNLVDWTRVPLAFPNLKFVFRSWVYDNNQVSNWIYKKGLPVIVQVDATPIGSPKGSHYVVYLGDQKCMDPGTGKIESTSKYPNPLGYILYDITLIKPDDPIILIPSNKILSIRNGPGSDGEKLDAIAALCK